MNILKVELQVLNRLESFSILGPWMRALYRVVAGNVLDVFFDLFSLFGSVEKLMHPCDGWVCRITQTEWAVPGRSKCSAVDKEVALCRNCFRAFEVLSTVNAPSFLTNNPFATPKAQLREAIAGRKGLFVAAVNISPSFGSWFITRETSSVSYSSCIWRIQRS